MNRHGPFVGVRWDCNGKKTLCVSASQFMHTVCNNIVDTHTHMHVESGGGDGPVV